MIRQDRERQSVFQCKRIRIQVFNKKILLQVKYKQPDCQKSEMMNSYYKGQVFFTVFFFTNLSICAELDNFYSNFCILDNKMQPEVNITIHVYPLPFFNLKRILYKTGGRYIGMIISIFPPTSPLLAPLLFGYSSFADQTPRQQRPHGCQTPRRSYDSGRMGASSRGVCRLMNERGQ